MAHCTNCGTKWKATDIWKLGMAKDGKTCATCGERQYVSFKNGGFLMGLGYMSGTIGLLLIVLFPYYIRLSKQKEKELYGGERIGQAGRVANYPSKTDGSGRRIAALERRELDTYKCQEETQ